MAGNRILTNKFNLPETLVKAVEYDNHKTHGTISCTTVIDPAQIRYLKQRYDYETDVVDNIYALLGTCMHMVLERANIDSVRQNAFLMVVETLMMKADEIRKSGDEASATKLTNGSNWLLKLIPVFFPETQQRYIFEKTLQLPVLNHVISGTFDLYDKQTAILWDYKVCGTFMWTNPEARKKWEEQTNIYAYMLRMEGLPVNGIRIVAFFRDWNHYGSSKNSNYPDMQIKEIVMPLWSMEKTKQLIYDHISKHVDADNGIVKECSGEDRWASADVYAVHRFDQANKRTSRAESLHPSQKDADNWIKENKHKFINLKIELRPGESRRCKSYCPVSKFCPQYKKELERNNIA